ncbi:sensor histidine kinase [Brachybacterium fresconis]|uniref:Two-component system sensor histidine kinase DesK n=1 Tax=Brachybacterium fresconis TaxID=173363 RepID=A0ABS4YPK5_9MICO|nr:sensor histidine kinase [Brachybacterium fresconis]MBP2410405.1 two-component system sensor histidine kinase DesK [Brachybacterium fresconis]
MRTDEAPAWGAWARGGEEAPVARPLTPRAIHRAAVESGGLPFALPPVIFIAIPIVFAWIGTPGPGAALVTVMMLVYGLLFVYCTGIALYPHPVRLAWFGVCTALLLALIPILGQNVLYMVMFQAMTHVLLLPWRWAGPTMIAMSLMVFVIALVLGIYVAAGLAGMGMLMSWGFGYGIRQQVLQEELDAAEERNAVLAVAAERERIGRDLHDLVGHSLTSLTISAQLARRLLETDPDAAREQLEHIEATVRQALSDVRATASGMQHVRAATEIASARTVLATVGIQAEVPTALPPLPDDRAELFGYVIREGVTNMVRHSRATRATITVDEESVTVADDGDGIPADTARSGLTGLEARVAIAGGHLEIASDDHGTRLTATMGEKA